MDNDTRYPRRELAALVDGDQARRYLEMLFGPHDLPEGAAGAWALRGVGEKDTPRYGVLRNSVWASSFDGVADHMRRWAQHDAGAFIVPAFVAGDVNSPETANIKEDGVLAFTALLVDIDKGDTRSALEHAVKHLGVPSMVVESGGKTETGKPKVHAYWALKEPTFDLSVMAIAREELALKLGGDPAFKRTTQIIRIPGSVHLKGGVPSLVKTPFYSANAAYDFVELVNKIEEMPAAPGVVLQPKLPAQSGGQAGGLTFGPNSSAADGPMSALTTTIREGGTEDKSRWSEFSKVAGHYIHCARLGEITPEEAFALTGGWVNAHMVPPWPIERVRNEFMGLLNRDRREKGEIAPVAKSANLVITAPDGHDNPTPENPLLTWSARRWIDPSHRPTRKWLVKGLVPAAKPSLLVAEGGAGKTYMALDLAMKVAGGTPDTPQTWMGEPLTEDAYGTAVFITAEDDKDEINIRALEIDQDGLLDRTEDRLITLPLINVGGTFPFASARRVTKAGVTIDEHGPSEKWEQLLGTMRQLHATSPVKLVIVDTMNATMHGEENSAAVVQEYFRQATRVCGELGAALMVTHHFRKQNPKDPIITAEDADAAGRGSVAIKASVRQVITIWHHASYKTVMEGMGLTSKPKMLYKAAVTKANNRGAYDGVKVLLRAESGLLMDVTERAAKSTASRVEQSKAWLLLAVRLAAEAGHPYSTAKSGAHNPGNRRGELPPIIRKWGLRNYETTLNELEADKLLVKVGGFVDVPGGPLARGLEPPDKKTAYDAPNWSLYEYNAAIGAVVPK